MDESNLRKSPLAMDIELNKSLFTPGDIINGLARLSIRSAVLIQKIQLFLFGAAQVSYRDEKFSLPLVEPMIFHSEKVLVDQKKTIYRKPEPVLVDVDDQSNTSSVDENFNDTCACRNHRDPNGLSIGVHTFEFSFILPIDGVESSYISSFCPFIIKYGIDMVAYDHRNEIIGQNSQSLSVVKPVHRALSTISKNLIISKSFDMGKGRIIDVEVKLKKDCFTAAEAIESAITIYNG
ncbi:hypothetical protein AB6A40_009590 [Gnathostoma spinigerum]|uniref:Arrestin-like N-terminal domain-containing protein n=1 Tax=Gnathostoma spinigerum TaxID=75299 RepID=A0ABD6ESQ0_9BILA